MRSAIVHARGRSAFFIVGIAVVEVDTPERVETRRYIGLVVVEKPPSCPSCFAAASSNAREYLELDCE